MTEGHRPPAAGGKFTGLLCTTGQSGTQGRSGNERDDERISTPWLGARADMIATENERRTARNADRAPRRTGGEETDDEFLRSERPGATGARTTLPPPSPPGLPDKHQFAAVLQDLSPSRQNIILKVFESLAGKAHTTTQTFGGTSTATNAAGEPSLSAALERGSDLFQDQSLEIPPAIIKLGLARVHIPLTLLTSSAIRKIYQDPIFVKTKKVVTSTGQKLDLMDLSAWPDESSIPPERFFEAWQNMLKIYARIGDDTVTNRFQTHFNYILALPDFAEDYKAILRFDCEVRRRYMNNPARFSPTDSTYQNCLNAIKLRVLSEEIKAGRQSQSDSSRRFSPYPQGGRRDNRAMRAGGSRPRNRPASYARGQDITQRIARIHPSEMAVRQSPYMKNDVSSSMHPARSCASSGTSPGTVSRSAAPKDGTILVHSTEPGTTMPDPQNACVRDRIVTPYNADAFERLLRHRGLLDRYPQLPHKIRDGFPLGDFAPLTRTFTPENHSSALSHPHVIDTYIQEELYAGRFSGPFSKSTVEQLLRSHFRSSPLAVVEKAGSPGKFRVVRNYSFKDDAGISVNDQIDPDGFQTLWGTAVMVAGIVSRIPLVTKLRFLLGPFLPSALLHTLCKHPFLAFQPPFMLLEFYLRLPRVSSLLALWGSPE